MMNVVDEQHRHHPNEDDWWRLEQDKLKQMELMVEELRCICKALQPPAATDFRLVQIVKGEISMIIGVQAGQSADFRASLVPANAAALQSGPVFSTTDSLVVLSPAPNGDPFGVVATVDATNANASFDLKVDGTTLNGAITHTFTIPISQAPPPQAVDFDLEQLVGVQINPLKKK